jgi:hypothetical protein
MTGIMMPSSGSNMETIAIFSEALEFGMRKIKKTAMVITMRVVLTHLEWLDITLIIT